MSKVNLWCWVVALFCLMLSIMYNNYQSKKIERIEKDKEALIINLEKRNNDILAISKRNKELEASAKSDTSGFDWGFDISDNPVVKRLQEQCSSCPK